MFLFSLLLVLLLHWVAHMTRTCCCWGTSLPGAGGGLAGATGLGGVAQVYGGDGVVELDAGMLGGEEDDLPPLATPPAAVELTAEQEETVEQVQLGCVQAVAPALLTLTCLACVCTVARHAWCRCSSSSCCPHSSPWRSNCCCQLVAWWGHVHG